MGQSDLQTKTFATPLSQLRSGNPTPRQNTHAAVPAHIRGAVIRTITPNTEKSTRSAFAALPFEPEDARITGTTRSLDRRLLALNVPRPATRVAGQTQARNVA